MFLLSNFSINFSKYPVNSVVSQGDTKGTENVASVQIMTGIKMETCLNNCVCVYMQMKPVLF